MRTLSTRAFAVSSALECHGSMAVPMGLAAWVRHVEGDAGALLAALEGIASHSRPRSVIAAIGALEALVTGPSSTLLRLASTRSGIRRLDAGMRGWLNVRWREVGAHAVSALATARRYQRLQEPLESFRVQARHLSPIGERLILESRLAETDVARISSQAGVRAVEKRLGYATALLGALASNVVMEGVHDIASDPPHGIPGSLWRTLIELEYPRAHSLVPRRNNACPQIQALLHQELMTLGERIPQSDVTQGMVDVLAHWRLLPKSHGGTTDFSGPRIQGRVLVKHAMGSVIWPRDFIPVQSGSGEPASSLAPGARESAEEWFLHPIRSRWALDPARRDDRLVYLLRGVPGVARVWETTISLGVPHRVVPWAGQSGGGSLTADEWASLFRCAPPNSGLYERLPQGNGVVEVLMDFGHAALARVLQQPKLRRSRSVRVADSERVLVVVERARRGDHHVEGLPDAPALVIGRDTLIPVRSLEDANARFLFHPRGGSRDSEVVRIHQKVAPYGVGLAVVGTATMHGTGEAVTGTIFAWPHAWLPVVAPSLPPWYVNLQDHFPDQILAAVSKLTRYLEATDVLLGVVHETMFAFAPRLLTSSGEIGVNPRLILIPMFARTDESNEPLGPLPLYRHLGFAGMPPPAFREDAGRWAQTAFALFACDLLWGRTGDRLGAHRDWAQVVECAKQLLDSGIGVRGGAGWGDLQLLLWEPNGDGDADHTPGDPDSPG